MNAWLVFTIVLLIGSLLVLIGGALYAWLELSGRFNSQFGVDAERERASYAIHQQMMRGLDQMLKIARDQRGDRDGRGQR